MRRHRNRKKCFIANFFYINGVIINSSINPDKKIEWIEREAEVVEKLRRLSRK